MCVLHQPGIRSRLYFSLGVPGMGSKSTATLTRTMVAEVKWIILSSHQFSELNACFHFFALIACYITENPPSTEHDLRRRKTTESQYREKVSTFFFFTWRSYFMPSFWFLRLFLLHLIDLLSYHMDTRRVFLCWLLNVNVNNVSAPNAITNVINSAQL